MADPMNAAEVALLNDRNNILGGGGGAMIWIIALIFLFLGGGNFGFGNNGRGDYVTQSDLTNQLNAQSTQTQLQQLGIQTADNNYQTARLISEQTNQMLQQNNANLINAIQGFNTVNQNMTVGFNSINQNLTAGFAALAQQMCQLGYQMDKCCCEIKTQNLQNRLDDAQAALVNANANISNANQSQYILSQLGRFVAWTPSGTQAATVAAGG